MTVTFVVPVFRTEEFLPRCLDSIAGQTDGDFEVVVVDDCSPGECGKIVSGYDGRFRCVRQDRNRGLMQTRVRGLAEARGDYVVSVDSDDYVMPRVVEEIRRAASSGPDVIAYNISMDFGGRIEPHWCCHAAGACSAHEALARISSRTMQWNLCGKAIRRQTWLRTVKKLRISESLRLNVSEDFYACLPILMESETVVFSEYPGYRYCQNADSMCNRRLSFGKFAADAAQTLRAMREMIRFVARERKGPREVARVLCVGGRILKWAFWELRNGRGQ